MVKFLLLATIIFSMFTIVLYEASIYGSIDTTPPSISKIVVVYPQMPITPWDIVKVHALVVDDRSGVENVTLYYKVRRNLEDTSFVPISMNRIDGNDLNGTYEAEIPAQQNGTFVYYYISACDKAGNVFNSSLEGYEVYLPPSYLLIEIGIKDINMSDLSAMLEVIVVAQLPSRYDKQELTLEASNGLNGHSTDLDFFFINVSKTQRFFYLRTMNWKVHLIGNPNEYPFDTYFLNLNFTVWWGSIKELEAEDVYYDIRLLNVWEEPKFKKFTITNTTYPQIIYNIEFNRACYGIIHVRLIPILLFLLIGASLIIEPKDLQNRLTIYLNVFIFTIGFFIEIKEYLPFHVGPTNAEYLLLFLTTISVLFSVCSIVASELQDQSKKHSASISLAGDLIPTIISFIFSLWLEKHIHWSLPLWYFILIIFSLSCGLIIRLFRSKKYQNLRVKIAERFRNLLVFSEK